MSRLSRFHSWHAAAAIVPTLFLAGAAHAAPASNDDLRQQISALEEQVRRLEGRQEAPSTELVDRAVADVLRDADRRSQLLDPEPGLTAGYTDGKFIIQSADGAFRLNPSVGFQFRYVANDRKEAKNGTSDDFRAGLKSAG